MACCSPSNDNTMTIHRVVLRWYWLMAFKQEQCHHKLIIWGDLWGSKHAFRYQAGTLDGKLIICCQISNYCVSSAFPTSTKHKPDSRGSVWFHDDVIKWNHFPRYWAFVQEFTGHWWIPRTKASDVELWCFLDLRLNIRLSKQLQGWWFETLLPPLWLHCNVKFVVAYWRHMAAGICANLGLDNCLLPDSSKMFRMIITNLRLETKHLELQWYNLGDNDFTQ